mgnify:CR=1 FL=1
MGRKQSSNYMGYHMLKHLGKISRPETAQLNESLVIKQARSNSRNQKKFVNFSNLNMISSPKSLQRPHTSQHKKGSKSPNMGDETESAKSEVNNDLDL